MTRFDMGKLLNELFCVLDAQEQEKFELFIKGYAANKSKKLLQYYDQVISGKYHEQTAKNHKLVTLLKQFLILQKVEKDTLERERIFLKELAERDAKDIIPRVVNKSEKQLQGHGRASDYQLAYFEMLSVRQAFQARDSISVEASYYPALFECNELHHLHQSLRLFIIQYLQYANFKGQNGSGLGRAWRQFPYLAVHIQVPSIQVYVRIISIYLNDWDDGPKNLIERCREVTEIIEKFPLEELFSKPELREVYSWVLNFLIKSHNNSGMPEILELLGDAYQIGLETGHLFLGDFVPGRHFKNAIEATWVSGKEELAKQLFDSYKRSLNLPTDKQFLTYAELFLTYSSKDFQKTIAIAEETRNANDFQDSYLLLKCKRLEVKASYEIEDHWKTGERLERLKKSTMNTKLVQGYHREVFRTWVNFMARMIYVGDESRIVKRLERLKREVIESSSLDDKDWFLAKLDQGIGKYY